MNETFDYVIVGGGSAGCVLLLEAGGAGRNPLYRVPLVTGKLFRHRFDDCADSLSNRATYSGSHDLQGCFVAEAFTGSRIECSNARARQ